MNDAMYEHPATRANLETLRARGVDGARARRRRARLAGASGASGGCASRRSCWPPSRRSCRRGAALDWTVCRCSSPPAARASRSTRCASSATARRAAWASRSPTRPRAAAPRSPCRRQRRAAAQPGVAYEDVATAAELRGACRDALRRLRRAADGRRGGRLPPGRRAREDKLKKDETRRELDLAARAHRGRARGAAGRAPARADARRLRRRARRARRSSYARGKLERKGLDAVVVNDISRAGHRLRRGRQRGDDRHRRRRAARAADLEGARSRRRFSTRC